MSSRWAEGYMREDIEVAQQHYDLVFPPDLVALYIRQRPVDGYDWRTDEAAIRSALAWPGDGLIFDVEHNVLWLPEWGTRPPAPEARAEIVRAAVAGAPKLIPLMGHRYLAAEPYEAGNPVFSIYQSDIITYGDTIDAYFDIEFGLTDYETNNAGAKYIRFWSDLVDRNNGFGSFH